VAPKHDESGIVTTIHMKIVILGSGDMAQDLGRLVVAGAHDLIGTGNDCPARAVFEADVVVLAVDYRDARGRLGSLAGKVVLDVTIPVDGASNALIVPPEGSAIEEYAALAPDLRLVKAFINAPPHTTEPGASAAGECEVLIAGDDEPAKGVATRLMRDGGLDPIDVGPLERARELEALALLQISLQDAPH
jgi:predicted dinucleotide-binding enzyme